MKRFVLIMLCVAMAGAFVAHGQVLWLGKSYDFRLIKESDGIRTGALRFVNRGSEPVVITDARVSCGCTGVDYPQDPVAPGDTATLRVSYNPLNRPGKFNKSVRVYIGDNQIYTVRITGNVLGTPESLAQFYPVEAGALRLSQRQLKVGTVPKGKTTTYFINGYNQSMDTIPVSLVSGSEAVSVATNFKELPPGETVTWSITFDTRKQDRLGPFEIILTAKGGENEVPIPFSGSVVLDMTPDTPKK